MNSIEQFESLLKKGVELINTIPLDSEINLRKRQDLSLVFVRENKIPELTYDLFAMNNDIKLYLKLVIIQFGGEGIIDYRSLDKIKELLKNEHSSENNFF